MSDPRKQDVRERAEREPAIGFAGSVRDSIQAAADARAFAPPSADAPDADQRSARILVLTTIAAALVVAGGIEWFGWQIVYRHADPATVTPPDLLGTNRGHR